MRRIISVWLPEFPVERFLRERRKLRLPTPSTGLPFALVEKGQKGLRLYAVNMSARQFGLGPGQRLADARAAVPDLITEQHEPEKDMASLLGLARWLERYSPWVAPYEKDGLLLDSSGVSHLFGGEGAMQADMKNRLAAYGFTTRLSFGNTIGTAWALARFGKDTQTDLHPLPIEALRIDANATRTLRRLGLKTIGSLLALPRASLARRFRGESIHENVLLRLDELTGHRHEALNAINPPSSFMAHRALMEPVINHEGLEAVLRGLVHALTVDLDAKGQGAIRLILKLFKADGGRAQIPVGLSAPSHDAKHILRLLLPKLDTLDAGFGIDAMTLEARETASVVMHQNGFMEDDQSTTLAELNDRVLNREDRGLSSLQAVASHLPERAEREAKGPHQPFGQLLQRKSDLVLGRPRRSNTEGGAAASRFSPGEAARRADEVPFSHSPRPFLIFETPEPARVIASVPDGPPMRLTWRRVTRKLVRSQGPERIAPEWWHLKTGERPRDYYHVEDEQGRRYWLYRDGLYGEDDGDPPKWFVHGLSA
jgi:protein ImuB